HVTGVQTCTLPISHIGSHGFSEGESGSVIVERRGTRAIGVASEQGSGRLCRGQPHGSRLADHPAGCCSIGSDHCGRPIELKCVEVQPADFLSCYLSRECCSLPTAVGYG